MITLRASRSFCIGPQTVPGISLSTDRPDLVPVGNLVIRPPRTGRFDQLPNVPAAAADRQGTLAERTFEFEVLSFSVRR